MAVSRSLVASKAHCEIAEMAMLINEPTHLSYILQYFYEIQLPIPKNETL